MEPNGPVPNRPQSSEINPGPGFRIRRRRVERPPVELIQKLGEFPSPEISDQLNRLYAVTPDIRCLTGPHHHLVGPACTVKVFPGDNLMVHKSLDIAQPGDVVVVDAGASRMNAALGDLISTKAKHRKIAGFVVDGFVRDLPDIMRLDFPVFARGTTSIGPLHRGPGEINFPICCGGVVVNPGDVVVADAFGVVMVPHGSAEEVLQRLAATKAMLADYLEGVKRGVFSNKWVDDLLAAEQCPIED